MLKNGDVSYFDLGNVYNHFNNAIINQVDDDIDIPAYLAAYDELYKFFKLMGNLFNFISSDLRQKIDVMRTRLGEDENNYHSVKRMIDHEKSNNLLEKKDYVNGSRTMLRLHRGLEFIMEYLTQLSLLSDAENTAASCQNAYNKTLAKHHTWLLRQSVKCLTYVMPSKEELFQKVCGTCNIEETTFILPKVLEVIANVLKRTQFLFETHNLLNLP